jgi:hypothetical protein
MRKLAVIVMAALSAASSIAFAAARGDAASKAELPDALAHTSHVPSLRYAFQVRIRKSGVPLALHVRGQSDARTISVHLATSGMTGAALLDGPFLYEEAPNGVAVFGKVRWLRLTVARLPATSPELNVVHALSPAPLLRVIAASRLSAGSRHEYRGTVAYDDPAVRNGLSRLTGGIEFRSLKLTVTLGRDRLVHRLRLTGRTADGSSTLDLSARLFAFGKPVHVSPPKPGTFMDDQLEQLSE